MFGARKNQKVDSVLESEPFLDEDEQAANAEIEYPSNAPRIYTPGKSVNSLAAWFQGPKKLRFAVQLAHANTTRRVSDFTSVRALYDRVAEQFADELESVAEIMFCTLNTRRVDMDMLLGAHIMLGDTLYVHVKSPSRKSVQILKNSSSLGLTITDNGAGIAFIKRIKPDSISSIDSRIQVGDHIESINGQATVGWRHYEVARKLRAIPIGQRFSMSLVEPLKSDYDMDTLMKDIAVQESLNTNDAIRLRSHGEAEMSQGLPTELIGQALDMIDDELENWVGIRDSALASDIYDLWTSSDDADQFATAIDDTLGPGIISDDAIFGIYNMLSQLGANT